MTLRGSESWTLEKKRLERILLFANVGSAEVTVSEITMDVDKIDKWV